MTEAPAIFLGKGAGPVDLVLSRANRHGLIAGATGTGKTVTLQILAEGFSRHGVPVFVADVKGDLAGLSQPGTARDFLADRAAAVDLEDYRFAAFPVVFWDLYGERGHPVRTTISEMGPLLLSRLLALNETQEGVLNIAFRVADDEGLLLLDLKDLRAMLNFVAGNSRRLSSRYGNVSSASVGAFPPREAKAVKVAAETFRANPAFDAAAAISELGVGEALVSTLDTEGVSGVVERTLIRPPASRLGPDEDDERRATMAASTVADRYDTTLDRDTAYGLLAERAEEAAARETEEREAREPARSKRKPRGRRRSSRQGDRETFVKGVARSVGRQLGSALLRGLLGSLMRR